jgi:threonyl-tRNA synthetase
MKNTINRVYGTSFLNKRFNWIPFITWRGKTQRSQKIRKELELFAFSQSGSRFTIMLPKGCIERTIRAILKKHKKALWASSTPHIGQKELYVTSGHYAKYGADSFQPPPHEGEEFY